MAEPADAKLLADDDKKFILEEFKEVGHEVRYRDILMIQEFSISMAGVGLVANYLSSNSDNALKLVILVFIGISLWILSLHMRNIHHDRLVGVRRKDELGRLLDFKPIHQNVGGKARLGAPRLMVWLMFLVSISWTVWTLTSICQAVQRFYHGS